MSYDISIADEEFNHTYNTNTLFKEILPGDAGREAGIKGLYGMTGAEAAEYIEAGLERLNKMLGDKGEDASDLGSGGYEAAGNLTQRLARSPALPSALADTGQ